MTELEKYVEDMRKNMSSNQLEMKEYFIKLAQALNADLQAKEFINTTVEKEKKHVFIMEDITLSSVYKIMVARRSMIYKTTGGKLLIHKFDD